MSLGVRVVGVVGGQVVVDAVVVVLVAVVLAVVAVVALVAQPSQLCLLPDRFALLVAFWRRAPSIALQVQSPPTPLPTLWERGAAYTHEATSLQLSLS